MTTQNPTIRLSFIPTNERATPARTGDIARDAVTGLRDAGYDVTPAYTDERGGPAYDLIMEAAKAIHNNKEMLQTLIGLATPIVKYLLDWYQKQNNAPASKLEDFEVIVVIEGAAATARSAVEANDDALLRQLLTARPSLADTVTRNSQLNITVKVPLKPSRRTR